MKCDTPFTRGGKPLSRIILKILNIFDPELSWSECREPIKRSKLTEIDRSSRHRQGYSALRVPRVGCVRRKLPIRATSSSRPREMAAASRADLSQRVPAQGVESVQVNGADPAVIYLKTCSKPCDNRRDQSPPLSQAPSTLPNEV